MKIKSLFPIVLLLLTFSSIAKAADFNSYNYHFTRYAKIAAIDKELNQAKSLGELKAVAIKMYTIILKNVSDTCKEPKASDFKSFCADVSTKAKATGSKTDTVEFLYEQRLWEVACAVMGVDDLETAKIKIQTWWNKYKTKCKCDSLGFNIPNGNLLKFSVSQSLPDVIDTMVSTYGLDINFKDPVDGKNVLDYVNDELIRFKSGGISQESIKIYEDYRASLIKLGAKPSK